MVKERCKQVADNQKTQGYVDGVLLRNFIPA
jgi:hypothetical protein